MERILGRAKVRVKCFVFRLKVDGTLSKRNPKKNHLAKNKIKISTEKKREVPVVQPINIGHISRVGQLGHYVADLNYQSKIHNSPFIFL